MINIWGADHQGHVPRMKAVMEILGYKGEFHSDHDMTRGGGDEHPGG